MALPYMPSLVLERLLISINVHIGQFQKLAEHNKKFTTKLPKTFPGLAVVHTISI